MNRVNYKFIAARFKSDESGKLFHSLPPKTREYTASVELFTNSWASPCCVNTGIVSTFIINLPRLVICV